MALNQESLPWECKAGVKHTLGSVTEFYSPSTVVQRIAYAKGNHELMNQPWSGIRGKNTHWFRSRCSDRAWSRERIFLAKFCTFTSHFGLSLNSNVPSDGMCKMFQYTAFVFATGCAASCWRDRGVRAQWVDSVSNKGLIFPSSAYRTAVLWWDSFLDDC